VEQLEDATVVSTQAPSTSIVSAELKMPVLNAATSAACQACFFLLGDNDWCDELRSYNAARSSVLQVSSLVTS
jgi:hypothetical protein